MPGPSSLRNGVKNDGVHRRNYVILYLCRLFLYSIYYWHTNIYIYYNSVIFLATRYYPLRYLEKRVLWSSFP